MFTSKKLIALQNRVHFLEEEHRAMSSRLHAVLQRLAAQDIPLNPKEEPTEDGFYFGGSVSLKNAVMALIEFHRLSLSTVPATKTKAIAKRAR